MTRDAEQSAVHVQVEATCTLLKRFQPVGSVINQGTLSRTLYCLTVLFSWSYLSWKKNTLKNKCQSLRFRKNAPNFSQHSTTEKNGCYTNWNFVNFHWISNSDWFKFRVYAENRSGRVSTTSVGNDAVQSPKSGARFLKYACNENAIFSLPLPLLYEHIATGATFWNSRGCMAWDGVGFVGMLGRH